MNSAHLSSRIIELRPAGALEALAAEEAVLEAVDSGAAGPAWLLWTSPRICAVLGTARPAAGDLFLDALRSDGVEVWRRRSGGGTVLLGPESPVVSCVARLAGPGAGSIRESYREFCEVPIAALDRLSVAAHFEPPADLAVGSRKIAGLAQRRKRCAVLATASVLAGPLPGVGRHLREPAAADAPAYRAGRPHREFMTSLAGQGVEVPSEALRKSLLAELASRGATRGELTSAEEKRAAAIARELADPAWIYRF